MKFGYLRHDDDAHWYLVPAEDIDRFDSLMRESYEVEPHSDRWYDICDEISEFPRCDDPQSVKCVVEE